MQEPLAAIPKSHNYSNKCSSVSTERSRSNTFADVGEVREAPFADGTIAAICISGLTIIAPASTSASGKPTKATTVTTATTTAKENNNRSKADVKKVQFPLKVEETVPFS
jgi:hypothetical protein